MVLYSKILHKSNLKATPLREAVLAELIQSGRGLSHQDLNQLLSVPFDRSSLFRTLNTLEEKGILHKIVDADGVAKYAYSQNNQAESAGHHAHFVCTRCKNIFCLDYSVALARIEVPEGFEKESVDMQVHGICDQCRHNDKTQH